jgi:hypothetical protein
MQQFIAWAVLHGAVLAGPIFARNAQNPGYAPPGQAYAPQGQVYSPPNQQYGPQPYYPPPAATYGSTVPVYPSADRPWRGPGNYPPSAPYPAYGPAYGPAYSPARQPNTAANLITGAANVAAGVTNVIGGAAGNPFALIAGIGQLAAGTLGVGAGLLDAIGGRRRWTDTDSAELQEIRAAIAPIGEKYQTETQQTPSAPNAFFNSAEDATQAVDDGVEMLLGGIFGVHQDLAEALSGKRAWTKGLNLQVQDIRDVLGPIVAKYEKA